MDGKKLEAERHRLWEMTAFEREYADREFICGIDEVGRGPLAGPVVAAAVILPKDCEILYINDSKKLTKRRRELLYGEITEKAVSYGIGCVSPEEIDRINILQATYEAMRQAVSCLSVKPQILLNDAVIIPGLTDIPQRKIIKGDAKSVSIAAASIVAKVTRDRMMQMYDGIYPGYGFGKNSGYGTKEHREAILRMGITPIHRRTFLKKLLADYGSDTGYGQTHPDDVCGNRENSAGHTQTRPDNAQIGRIYEEKAVSYMRSKGMSILDTRYRIRQGEIDVVAREGDTIVFCEVKYRKDGSFGNPLDAVDLKKQERIWQAAVHYLTHHGLTGQPCRFDVIGFEKDKMTHIADAFRGGTI